MRRLFAVLCAAGWSLAAMAADAPNGTVERERALLKDAFEQSQKDHADLKALSAELKAILDDSAFERLSDGERHSTYILAAAVLCDMQDYEGAKPLLQRATSMTETGDLDWRLLFEDSYRLHDYPQAAAGLTALALHWPEKLADYRDDAFFTVAREIRKTPETRAQAETFMTALFDAKWKVSDKFGSADPIWLPLMGFRIERGDVEGARRVAALLDDPTILIDIRADKRFDALVKADPDRFDVMKRYEDTLADLRTLSASSPDKLRGVNVLAEALYRLNRPQESLTLLEDALARDAKDPKTFSDRDDQINWTQNQLSNALFAVGRDDEALAALEKGASLKEGGEVNISQAINLAGIYDARDRPADALKAVAALKTSDPSPYGRMALEDVRARAYFALGDRQNLADALQYMKAHARDGSQPFLNTMLRVGELDAAAVEVIGELEDPQQRGSMLYRLQDYAPDPHATKVERQMHETWLAVRGRKDVAAEIAKVGRIESYPLRSPSY